MLQLQSPGLVRARPIQPPLIHIQMGMDPVYSPPLLQTVPLSYTTAQLRTAGGGVSVERFGNSQTQTDRVLRLRGEANSSNRKLLPHSNGYSDGPRAAGGTPQPAWAPGIVGKTLLGWSVLSSNRDRVTTTTTTLSRKSHVLCPAVNYMVS